MKHKKLSHRSLQPLTGRSKWKFAHSHWHTSNSALRFKNLRRRYLCALHCVARKSTQVVKRAACTRGRLIPYMARWRSRGMTSPRGLVKRGHLCAIAAVGEGASQQRAACVIQVLIIVIWFDVRSFFLSAVTTLPLLLRLIDRNRSWHLCVSL